MLYDYRKLAADPTEEELEAAREANRAYQREYNRAHPEKKREWNRNYWIKKAQRNAADTK